MANAGSQDNRSRDARSNAFDVLIRRNGWFLATFYALWALLAGLLSYARVATAENPPLAWPEIVIIVIVAVAATVGAAFPLAFGFVEGIPMVLAELRKRFYREEGREEGPCGGPRRAARKAVRRAGRKPTKIGKHGWNAGKRRSVTASPSRNRRPRVTGCKTGTPISPKRVIPYA